MKTPSIGIYFKQDGNVFREKEGSFHAYSDGSQETVMYM